MKKRSSLIDHEFSSFLMSCLFIFPFLISCHISKASIGWSFLGWTEIAIFEPHAFFTDIAQRVLRSVYTMIPRVLSFVRGII